MPGTGRALRNLKMLRTLFSQAPLHPGDSRQVRGLQERRAELRTERWFDREGTSEEEAQGQGRQAASAAAGHRETPSTPVRGFQFHSRYNGEDVGKWRQAVKPLLSGSGHRGQSQGENPGLR